MGFLYLKRDGMGNKMNFAGLLQVALKKAGKNEVLAVALDLSPSVLSRRINGENGWSEKEIDRLLEYTSCEVSNASETSAKINALKETLKIVLNDDKP